jgi:segregation and condensation protein A
MDGENYEVKLEVFEGPLDLLLHLINKNEVDIFDIPIAKITDQYLEYIEMMKALNMDLAGDFLVMASTLTHIKSRMLLPGITGEEEGEEDPRLEITRPLLEYMAFKEVADGLSQRKILNKDVFLRQVRQVQEELPLEKEPQIDANLFQLIDAFKRVLEQRTPSVQLKFRLEKWSVKEKTKAIIERLKEKGEIFFQELFDEEMGVAECVVTFLALLELVHMGLVRIFQPSMETQILLIPNFDEECVLTDV